MHDIDKMKLAIEVYDIVFDTSSFRRAVASSFRTPPQDELNPLRERLGSGGRAVRLKGTVYVEGDIVSNVVGSLQHEGG